MSACHYCGTTEKEMRPYGPKGAMLCFACMVADPQREAEAKANFASQLAAAGPVAVIGTDAGPFPVKHLAAPLHSADKGKL